MIEIEPVEKNVEEKIKVIGGEDYKKLSERVYGFPSPEGGQAILQDIIQQISTHQDDLGQQLLRFELLSNFVKNLEGPAHSDKKTPEIQKAYQELQQQAINLKNVIYFGMAVGQKGSFGAVLPKYDLKQR